jgi:hypothetical protein
MRFGRPKRVEGELHMHIRHAWYAHRAVADFVGKHITHRTTRRGQRHQNRDLACVRDLQIVDKPEIRDVERDLGVVHIV